MTAPVEIGVKQDSAAGTTTVITLTVAAPVGDAVVVAMFENGSNVVSSVTDSRGNTYTSRVQLNSASGTTGRLVVYDTVVGTNLQIGDTITITTSGSRAAAAAAYKVPGGVFDQVVSGRANTIGTAASSGNTGVLAQADEVCMGFVGWVVDQTFAPTGVWGQTGLTTNLKTTAAGNVARLEPEWQETAATTAIAATGTLGAAEGWVAACICYKVGVTTPITGSDTGTGAGTAAITGIGGADSGSGVDSGSVVASGGPPVNTALPVISGYPTVGRHLTTTDGTWSGSPTSFSYQWQRADDPAFTINVTNIGSNQNNYDPVLADVLKYIRVTVTATNGGGSTPATAVRVGLVGRQWNSGLNGHTAVCGNLAGIFVPGVGRVSGAETGQGADIGGLSASVTSGVEPGTGIGIASVFTNVQTQTERGTTSENGSVSIAVTFLAGADTGHGDDTGDVATSAPTPTPIPEPLPFLAESVVRVFVCGEMGQKLYAEMEPVAYADAENQNSLHTFLCAIGSQFEEAWQFVRDPIIAGQRIPGWSIIVDLDRTPNKALAWLAQFVGVTIDPSLSDERQRERIHETDGWKRGSVAAFMAAAKTHLTGDRTVVMHERYTSPYRILVVTRTYETPNPANVLNALIAQKPAGIVLEYYVVTGRTYLEVRDENADYSAAKAAYADYETMRATRIADVPATDPLIPSETLTPSGTLAPGG